MNKILIFSDLHVHTYKDFNDHPTGTRLDNIIKILDYIFKFAKINGIRYIFFCGDLFDQFAVVSTKAIHETMKVFKYHFDDNPFIEFISISGNHDLAAKNIPGNNAHSILKTFSFLYDRFIVLDGTIYQNDLFVIAGIPYYSQSSYFIDELKRINKEIDKIKLDVPKYLLTHQMIWPDQDLIVNDIEPDSVLFENYHYVFNGHIHHHGSWNNDRFINVGNPLHRDLGDLNDKKYIIILDIEDDTWIAKDITEKSPQFIKKFANDKISENIKSKNYIIEQHRPPVINTDEKEIKESFQSILDPQQLVRNYWKQVSDDEYLLQTGLNLLP